jgi:tetratricopeptide (TPR) repeat protein
MLIVPFSIHPDSEDHPPQATGLHVSRSDYCETVLTDLVERGVAVLQGPGGSGTSWAAWELAQRWAGPVTWVRPGMWLHMADLVRPLWDEEHPTVLQQESCERLVDAVLARLRSDGKLLVLDDLDPCFSSGAAGVPDSELRLFLAALEARELADSGAAVLITAHRGPRELSVPIRPLPALSVTDAEQLAGRSCTSLSTAWLRRPAALTLLRHLPEGAALPDDPAYPWPSLLLTLTEQMTRQDEEVLLTLALARRPSVPAALAAASGLSSSTIEQSLSLLHSISLVEPMGERWRCSRYIASAARALLPERLHGVLPTALLQRFGGFYLRAGQQTGDPWKSIDSGRDARLGLRYAVAAGDGRMALQGALHGGLLRFAEEFGAWRAIRDDLTLALSVPGEELEQAELAEAYLLLADSAARIGDHSTTGPALVRALPHAQAGSNQDMIREIHTQLARHLLLTGSGHQSLEHLRAALRCTERDGNSEARIELLKLAGSVHLQAGRLTKAQQNFEKALGLALVLNDHRRAASCRAGLGGVLMYRGRLRDAEVQLQMAAEEARDCDDQIGLTSRLLNVALVQNLRGDVRGAMASLSEAAAESPPGHPRLRARLLSMRGDLRRLAGDLRGAATDLDESLDAATLAGDRDALVEIWGAQGAWHRSAGNFETACQLFQQALDEQSTEREDALLAAREAELWHARAWHAAHLFATDGPSHLPQLLKAAEALESCRSRIPEEPFRVRYFTCAMQSLEVQLLSASLNGVAPLAQLYRIEELIEETELDSELIDTGSPQLRVLNGWALRLCSRKDEANKQAERAEIDAGMCGLATVADTARVLSGQSHQEWNGQAALLAQLLAFASSETPPPLDRETGAIPLHGPRAR